MDKKEIRNRTLVLSYYLKFIQADLNYLDDRDFAFQLHLLWLLSPDIGSWPQTTKWTDRWSRDLKIRKEKPTPSYLTVGGRTLETREFLRAREVQKKLREFLFKVWSEKWGTINLMPKAKITLIKEREAVLVGHDEAIDDASSMPQWFQVRYYPIGKDHLDLNIPVLNFASLLNGLPVDSIRRCKECGGYFINLSKRVKVFCDIRCAWKSHARLAREELKRHPRKLKAYQKKQKILMWHRYEERVKVKTPGAKINRRVKYGSLKKDRITKGKSVKEE